MAKKLLIDASHVEEVRVAVLDHKNQLEELDFETTVKRTLKGNVYLAKITRVEPSLQVAFVEYGGNRHGFLPFNEIHPDYFRIPIDDRRKIEEEIRAHETPDDDDDLDIDSGKTSKPKARAESATKEMKILPITPEGEITAEASHVSVAADNMSLTPEDENFSVEFSEETPIRLVSESNDKPSNGRGKASDTSAALMDEEVETIGGEGTEEFQSRRRKRLGFHERYKIQEVIQKGQVVLIQVVKEERKAKGAAVTTYLSFAGRYCVLMANSPRSGGVSRKISNLQERRKLKDVLKELNVPDSMSLIIRTAGKGLAKTEIKRDFDYLLRLWNKIREVTLKSVAPALIYEEANLIKRTIRDTYSKDIDEVWVQGDESYLTTKKLFKELMPSHEKSVKHYNKKSVPLFHHFGVEDQIERLHKPVVSLPSGGSIVFNQTEALVAIDINSGRATRERHIEQTAFNTNLEAADMIAKQLKLRDLAGLVVIDFIDMESQQNRNTVVERLKSAMNGDRARIQIGHISHFGLLELSRQRLRPSILESATIQCPHCHGTGMMRSMESHAMELLHSIEGLAIKGKNDILYFRTSPDIANYLLNYKRSEITTLEQYHHVRIFLEPDVEMISPQYEMLTTDLSQSARTAEHKRRTQTDLQRHKDRLETYKQSPVSGFDLEEESTPEEQPAGEAFPREERQQGQNRRRNRRGGRRRQGNYPPQSGRPNSPRPDQQSAQQADKPKKSWWQKILD